MDFQDYQRVFTAHIRDPKASARPRGVPARRMRVYNELLYNNVEGFLLACFPICRQVLGSRRWTRLVSSGRPSPPPARVTTEPSMVPTVRLTF